MSVVFDYAAWSTRFPELAAKVGEPLATACFQEAALYCDPVKIKNAVRCALIMNLITAHIAALSPTVNEGGAGGGLVGRISSATQGSVTVQAQLDIQAGSAQWWAQTSYGLQAWQALAPYRTMRYVPGRGRHLDTYSRFRG